MIISVKQISFVSYIDSLCRYAQVSVKKLTGFNTVLCTIIFRYYWVEDYLSYKAKFNRNFSQSLLTVYIYKAIVAVISVIEKTNIIENPQAPLQVANSKENKTWNSLKYQE